MTKFVYRRRNPTGLNAWIVSTPLFQARFSWWLTTLREDIHNETRSFVSFVLRGKLTETRYKVIPGTQQTVMRCIGDAGELTQEMADVHELRTYTRKAPTIYTMRQGIWHSVRAAPNTVTISLRGPLHEQYAYFIQQES